MRVLFWISVAVAAYCIIALAFPVSSMEYFPLTDTFHTHYTDLLGINGDGVSDYTEEWGQTLAVAVVVLIASAIFGFRKKK